MPVHYIFADVKLRLGRNQLKVTAEKGGKSYEDTIVWNYSPNSKKAASDEQPTEKKQEHIGL